ncbi:unnamed protein product, partial [Linum tenue]
DLHRSSAAPTSNEVDPGSGGHDFFPYSNHSSRSSLLMSSTNHEYAPPSPDFDSSSKKMESAVPDLRWPMKLRKAMGDKKKKTFMFIRLISAAGTGFFYVKKKSSKKVMEKLEFRKYDPRVNRHVLFTEAKMK